MKKKHLVKKSIFDSETFMSSERKSSEKQKEKKVTKTERKKERKR